MTLTTPPLPPGMRPWPGGDEPPADLDSNLTGGKVQFRDGVVQLPVRKHWTHTGGPDDIVAYTPAPPAPPPLHELHPEAYQFMLGFYTDTAYYSSAPDTRPADNVLMAIQYVLDQTGQSTPLGCGWRNMVTAPRDAVVDLWVRFETGPRRVPNARWCAKVGEWQLGQYHAGQYSWRPQIMYWRPLALAPTTESTE